ncbi:MAG: hypothetical protein ACXWPM_04160 [Bdellovibrionota bacterium]
MKKYQKWWMSGLFIAIGVGTTACQSFTDPSQVAFCARFTDAGKPVPGGSADIDAQVEDTSSAYVYELVGTVQLDEVGHGCTQLRDIGGKKGSIDVTHVKTKTLRAIYDGQQVDGIVTSLQAPSGQSYAQAEASFDLANPNPGDPGEIVILDLLNHSRGLLDKLQRGSDILRKLLPGNSGPSERDSKPSADRAS